MRVFRTNHIRLVLAVAIVLLPVLSAGQESSADLPNFRKVNDTLYRGGQPEEGSFKRLSEMGIKTVIDLRDSGERSRAEEAKARAAGLRYFNLPLSNFKRPSDTKVAEVLSIINSPENQPVFVHCNRGADRTGTIVAIYRIDHDGWTSEKAKQEAKRFGLGFWQVYMRDFIGDYYRRKSEQSVKAK
jgi:tyrosine-protein phosphatase SIW14